MVLVRRATQMLLAVLVVALALLPAQPAAAEETPWTLIVAPQIWFANIPAQVNTNTVGRSTTFTPDRALYPQYGGTVALRTGPWAFAVGALSTDYGIIRDYSAAPGTCFTLGLTATCAGTVGQDRVETSRIDLDFAITYTWLDTIKDVLDVTLGVGVKWVHLDGAFQIVKPAGNVYTTGRTRETFDENIYGPTLPINLNFHLTKLLFLPITVSPYIANDEYTSTFGTEVSDIAYGGTADIGFRYFFADTGVSVIAGYRGQVLTGGPLGMYGAHGPFFGVAIPFNF